MDDGSIGEGWASLNQMELCKLIAAGFVICALLLISDRATAQSTSPVVPGVILQQDDGSDIPQNDYRDVEKPVGGQDAQGRTLYVRSGRAIANAPEDPANILQNIEQRQAQREALLPFSPLEPFRERFNRAKESIYEAISLKLGINSNNLFQAISDGFPGTDRSGVASDVDIIGTWELINRGTPTQGQIFFQFEGRWDYGTTPPSDLGVFSLGSLIRTADSFNSYTPTFLPVRNLYWQQGSSEAGWIYRIGKITPDQTLGTSFHFSPFVTFLPTAAIGINAPVSDSGLGAVVALYPNDRFYVLGLISDANADRFDFGDIGAGDLFTAVELGYKINPMTERAGYSKFTISHTDGTSDGTLKNAQLGPEGWGAAIKIEQELTADGRAVGILKYGRTFNGSGLYKHTASAHLLLYDPPILPLKNDLIGVGFTWADPALAVARDEANLEIFYRIPFTPELDTTISYQSVFNPALNPAVDHASVISVRARTTF